MRSQHTVTFQSQSKNIRLVLLYIGGGGNTGLALAARGAIVRLLLGLYGGTCMASMHEGGWCAWWFMWGRGWTAGRKQDPGASNDEM